jgi:hypothetical protein
MVVEHILQVLRVAGEGQRLRRRHHAAARPGRGRPLPPPHKDAVADVLLALAPDPRQR